jgi:hypothetical protein
LSLEIDLTNLIRFGSHAEIIRRNGFPWIIPASGKSPAILRYPEYGLCPADRIEFASWLKLHPLSNISLVMSGYVVVFDIDVLDEDLVKEIIALAIKELGPIDFRRVGQAPKVSIFYRALDAIPTFAGAVIEIFCTAGSKQVLLFGTHPDTGGEYEWEDCSPLSHRLEQMPGVRYSQVVVFRERALKLVAESGYIRPQRQPSAFGPSHGVAGIGDMMSEILREIGVANADPTAVAASYFEQAPDGAKHYAMVSAVSVLVLRGYSDQQIVEALIDAYRHRVHDDPGLRNLLVCPVRVRRGMLRRGAVLPGKPVSSQLTDEQRAAFEKARGIVRGTFYSKLPRAAIASRAATTIECERDPAVRRALGNVVAAHLARHGWPDATIVSALSLASQRRIERLPGWIGRFKSAVS